MTEVDRVEALRVARVTLGWTEKGAAARTAEEWERDARELASFLLAAEGEPVKLEPLHQAVLPDEGKPPGEWTLAEWQGVLEELHYEAENQRATQDGRLFATGHAGLRWLVGYFMARRMNA